MWPDIADSLGSHSEMNTLGKTVAGYFLERRPARTRTFSGPSVFHQEEGKGFLPFPASGPYISGRQDDSRMICNLPLYRSENLKARSLPSYPP